MLGKFKTG